MQNCNYINDCFFVNQWNTFHRLNEGEIIGSQSHNSFTFQYFHFAIHSGPFFNLSGKFNFHSIRQVFDPGSSVMGSWNHERFGIDLPGDQNPRG